MVLRRPGQDSNQDNAPVVDPDDFGHGRIGFLVADDDVGANVELDAGCNVLGARVGQPVAVDPVVVDPKIPIPGFF